MHHNPNFPPLLEMFHWRHFFHFPGLPLPTSKSLITFMSTINPTVKYTFTYSEQTVTFLDVEIYLFETRKLKMKLYRKPNDCMKLLHSHSHHTIRCKESIIYSQVLRYNMIISEDYILQEELKSLTRILLAFVIIKNWKKP